MKYGVEWDHYHQMVKGIEQWDSTERARRETLYCPVPTTSCSWIDQREKVAHIIKEGRWVRDPVRKQIQEPVGLRCDRDNQDEEEVYKHRCSKPQNQSVQKEEKCVKR